MTQQILDGIVQHSVTTPRLTANVLERPSATAARTVVFVHGNVSSSLFWQPSMLGLDPEIRALAVDLRGFGDSQTLPVDATRGVRDFSDDVASVLDALGLDAVNLVGWSMGGGVVMQLLLDHPERVLSLTLVSPVSPYGFGGTRADGSAIDAVGAGTGGGGANPDFVARLEAHDTGEDGPTSPRMVYRTAYVKDPAPLAQYEDLWVESMLTTKTGPDNYPGDSTPTDAWPGFAAGTRGVLNTMVPKYFDVSGIADLAVKPPLLWLRGVDDAIVSDASFFDINYLGQVGVIPGWPGEDVAPAQPMIQQTRAVFDRYAAGGGSVTEISAEGTGHSFHLERPEEFRAALERHLISG
ncbi:alpha/beta hydrolase [Leifsonia sp. H3M29-4]|uniref:alpha/beta fold hydrolase n=1 Tax=Salinibacterium metalliresistens TaxID=3031321 RepID=UPI0023DBE8EF|nr:alpha/beta hydrolase [Salinibacterium metalliresistens]MDF1480052.1 alpha/beta hydrolase [Salinibacterium metalliresistens]